MKRRPLFSHISGSVAPASGPSALLCTFRSLPPGSLFCRAQNLAGSASDTALMVVMLPLCPPWWVETVGPQSNGSQAAGGTPPRGRARSRSACLQAVPSAAARPVTLFQSRGLWCGPGWHHGSPCPTSQPPLVLGLALPACRRLWGRQCPGSIVNGCVHELRALL